MPSAALLVRWRGEGHVWCIFSKTNDFVDVLKFLKFSAADAGEKFVSRKHMSPRLLVVAHCLSVFPQVQTFLCGLTLQNGYWPM